MRDNLRRGAIVAGTGPVGLVAALALAREGVPVTLVGERSESSSGRTVALFDDSIRLLAELGVWQEIAKSAAPLRALRIVDDTDNLFRWRPLTFAAAEIGLDAFGCNIELSALNAALRLVAQNVPGIHIIEGLAAAPFFDADRAGCSVAGQRLDAELIVAADGQRSPLREAAGITARLERLPQWAMTGIFRHQLPHENVSTEFHTREGPCTLVPLASLDESRGHQETSSLVWMVRSVKAKALGALDDEAFSLAVERRTHSILGKMQLAGPRGAVPLAIAHLGSIRATRLALVGEAAHAFPPIGAQGLNLGLRDAAMLAALAGEALSEDRDIGAADVLDAYQDARANDIATRSAAVNLMNRSLLSTLLPFDLARGLGMAALDLVGPLRRFVMREGVAPRFGR
ncbi:MAG: FAD-dependent monooxygenase [Hyphomicrobiales bacterium]|nr:FAD-dependent monooxygenase [Hyphomicrobiales bacterium]